MYVCSNGRQRLVVNKYKLEKERIVEVLDKSVLFKSNGIDNQETEDKSSYIVLLGCGKPSEAESVDLKIVNPDNASFLPENCVSFLIIALMLSQCLDSIWSS